MDFDEDKRGKRGVSNREGIKKIYTFLMMDVYLMVVGLQIVILKCKAFFRVELGWKPDSKTLFFKAAP